MQKQIFFVLLLFLASVYASAIPSDGLVIWNKNKPLTWKNFKNKQSSTSVKATTYSGMIPTMEAEDGELTISIQAFMDPKKSWVDPDNKDEDLLKHEQGHFDITEIYVRKFRQRLKNTEMKTKARALYKQVTKMYKKISKEWLAFQRQYDKQSNHHMDRQGQVQWDQRIAYELESLEAYAKDETIVIEYQE